MTHAEKLTFSTVYNVDTEEELTFSLPPKEALVAAFEYHRRVNGMPYARTDQFKAKMDSGAYHIKAGKFGLCLGPFWVRKTR